jgi:hypothetical protein
MDLKSFVLEGIARESLEPWQFWKPLSEEPGFKREPLFHRRIEDEGRTQLSRIGFHVIGGISPFLPLWAAPLCAIPLLGWVVFELHRVGRLTTGLVFALLFACSPYVVELLSFYYTPAGFYVVGLLPLLAVAAYVVLGPAPEPLGLLGRSLVYGIAFAICTVSRAGAGPLAGVALALLVVGVTRMRAGLGARAAVAGLALALAFGPYASLRPERHHAVWMGVWEGLGDFDRTKGYCFSDGAVRKRLLAAGATDLPPHRGIASADKADWLRESTFLRDEVLADVRADPAWYLTILAKRFVATLTQHKLLATLRADGSSFTPATSGNEGGTDVYYGFTKTADWIGLGPWRFELPLPALWVPLLLWLGWQRRRLFARDSPIWVLLSVAAGAMSVPLLITVAAGFETQSFVLVYYLGVALLCNEVADRLAKVDRQSEPR